MNIYKWLEKFQINNKIFHGIRNCVHIEDFLGPDYDQALYHLVKEVRKEVSKNSLNCVTRTKHTMCLIYVLCITLSLIITCAFTTSRHHACKTNDFVSCTDCETSHCTVLFQVIFCVSILYWVRVGGRPVFEVLT